MGYLVLARKYRPRTFAEVAGQGVVTRVLEGAIQEERVGHAYLFCGPRGTGKTTTARIFARALNCERGPTATPCGECEICVGIESGDDVDVIEIDAASNTGVDDVRGLRDSVGYAPMRSRFKIFLIDEVHMLSRNAFNALLKTLEEPPAHVKFLFCTTEPHRLPDTVLSRCQVMKLSPIPVETMAARIDEVFRLEGIEPEEGVSTELAKRARGGLRDALSQADQLLALVGNAPQVADLDRLAGGGGREGIEAVLSSLERGDRAGMLSALPPQEGDEPEFAEALLAEIRALFLVALAGVDHPLVEAGDAAQARLQRAKTLGSGRLESWLHELLHARERMRLLPSQSRLLLETTLLDMASPEAGVPLGEIARRLAELEARLAEGGHVASLPTNPPARTQPSPAPEPTADPSKAERTASRRSPAPAPADVPPPSELRRVAPPDPKPVVVKRPVSKEPARGEVSKGTAPARSDPPAPARGRTRRAATPRGTSETFSSLCDALEVESPNIASALRRAGRLAELSPKRAVLQVSGLRSDETHVLEQVAQDLCAEAFRRLTQSKADFVIENTDDRNRSGSDPFTQEVLDLFGGRLEE